MSVEEIGCCGAYCRTCRAYKINCTGCKTGYKTGERDLSKARCKIKVCCIKRELNTCSDCHQYGACETLISFYNKNGLKYKKYREATLFIRSMGYEEFCKTAHDWTNAYGKYK